MSNRIIEALAMIDNGSVAVQLTLHAQVQMYHLLRSSNEMPGAYSELPDW